MATPITFNTNTLIQNNYLLRKGQTSECESITLMNGATNSQKSDKILLDIECSLGPNDEQDLLPVKNAIESDFESNTDSENSTLGHQSFSNSSKKDIQTNVYQNVLYDESLDSLCADSQVVCVGKSHKIYIEDQIPIVIELQNIEQDTPSNTGTPIGSCLKANNKTSSYGVRVQFETPRYEDDDSDQQNNDVFMNEQTTLKSSKEQFSKLWTRLAPEFTDGSLVSNLKKVRNKKHRQPSGSSTVSVGSKSSITTNDSKSAAYERRALDGGWGWVVVFASFMVHCIADGVTMSFGILYVEFLSYFGESKSITSWIGSLFMAIPLLAGPLASYATDTYGCRIVTIWGSIIACLGFLMSAYANSIIMLYLTVGLVAGLGLAVCYVAAIVIVAFYFDKLRSLATGIAVAGSGIGTFIFAPLIQYLIDNYGWQGCMILLAGIFLNMAVCGALMRDLEWKMQKPRKSSGHNTTLNSELGSLVHSSDTLSDGMAEQCPNVPCLDELKRLVQSGDIESFLSEERITLEIPRSGSLVLLPTFLDKPKVNQEDVLPFLSLKSRAFEMFIRRYPPLTSRSVSQSGLDTPRESGRRNTIKINSINSNTETTEEASHFTFNEKENRTNATNQNKRNEVFEDKLTSNKNLPSWIEENPKYLPVSPCINKFCRRQSMSYRGAIIDILRYRLRSTSCPNISRSSRPVAMEVEKKEALKEIISSCADFGYCFNAPYVIFAASNFLLYVFYDTVYMYLTDYAQEIGIPPDEGANLVSVIGILNCIGMIVMGYLGDKTWVSPMLIYTVSMVGCGLSVIAMPFIVNYWLLATASAIFGLFISANYALTAVILVEMISLEAFGKSYGMLLLIQGIANLIGPPLVGYMSDATGNYVMPFVVSGLFIVFCGLMLTMIPLIKGYKNGRQNPTQT